jgi:beta-glucosidase
MNENTQPEKIDIYWKSIEHPATFEIQLSSGGGQFITVYKGTITETEKYSAYSFKKTVASDLRILLTSGKATVSEIKLDNVKK